MLETCKMSSRAKNTISKLLSKMLLLFLKEKKHPPLVYLQEVQVHLPQRQHQNLHPPLNQSQP